METLVSNNPADLRRHPHQINPLDNEDKFATLFSPATPRATPTASPRMHPVRHLAYPPTLSLRHEISRPIDSDPGSLVPVPPSDDPLSLSSDRPPSFYSLPVLSESGTSSADGGTQLEAVGRNSSMKFFDTFTKEAKRASELNRKGYLDELLLHEDDPLYWVKEESFATSEITSHREDDSEGSSSRADVDGIDTNKELSNSMSRQDSGSSNIHPASDDRLIDNIASDHDSDNDAEDDDQRDSRSSARTHVTENIIPRPKHVRSPSLPPVQSFALTAESPPRAASALSLSSPSIADHPAQTLPSHSEFPTYSSIHTSPSQNYNTLSTFSSRLMSSLLSSSRISPPSTSPTTHQPLDTLFADHASPVSKLQNARDISALPTASMHISRSQTHTGTMAIPRKQHTDHAFPVNVSISHNTPFASHLSSYIPPSGAPGFTGDDHSWDRGFSKDYDRERVERRSVLLKERKEGEGCVTVLNVALADLIRPHLPALARLPDSWALLYSLDQHGISLKTLYSRSENQRTKLAAVRGTLVAVKDSGETIFGAWIGEAIRLSKGAYYGGGDAFLWRFANGRLSVYKLTGKNDYVSLCEPDFISFGGGDGKYGLYLDDSLSEGSSAPCPTFDNDPLCSPGLRKGETVTFDCVGLEVWTVGL